MKQDSPLSQDLLRKMNAYWRAANYLSVGQLYLCQQSFTSGAAETVTCEIDAAWTLGYNAGAELYICTSEPGHKKV